MPSNDCLSYLNHLSFQILVEVKAAGINPVDTYIRAGAHAIKPQLPYTPGNDGSGIVIQIGSKVTKVKVRKYISGS